MSVDQMQRGFFITIEGIEGAGKSTVVAFMAKFLQEQQVQYVLTREPGGTVLSEKIRQLLLQHYERPVEADAECLLFFAGRAQHIAEVIRPALAAGKWVLCDRFTDASYAYQGGGRGIGAERIGLLEQWVQGDLRPDLTLLLDLPIEEGMSRVRQRSELDRIESEELAFFETVRQAYLARAVQHADRYEVIDAAQSLNKVCQDVGQILKDRMGDYRVSN